MLRKRPYFRGGGLHARRPETAASSPHKPEERGEQNGPTAPGPGSHNVHQPHDATPRHRRSEALQLAAPTSCPHTEDPHWRASAKLPLVSRWYVTLSAQLTQQRASHHI